MNRSKLLLGACAALCAIPIGGALMATAFASSALALFSDALVLPGMLILAAIAAATALTWWKLRRKRQKAVCGCQGGTGACA